MNENDVRDDEILRGLRRRMAGVEPLIPVPPAWVGERAGKLPRTEVRGRLQFAVAPLVGIAAVLVIVLGLAMRSATTPISGPEPTGPWIEFTYRVTTPDGSMPSASALQATADIMRGRLGGSGFVDVKTPDQVLVRVEGSTDVAGTRDLLENPGKNIEFVPLPQSVYGTKLAAGSAALPKPGTAPDPSLPVQFYGTQIDPGHVLGMIQATDQTLLVIGMQTSVQSEVDAWVASHADSYVELVVDGKIASVCSAASEPGDSTFVTCGEDLSQEQVNTLMGELGAGELPYPVTFLGTKAVPAPSGYSTPTPPLASPPSGPERTTPASAAGDPIAVLTYRLAPGSGQSVTAAQLATAESILRTRMAAAGLTVQVVARTPDLIDVYLYDSGARTSVEALAGEAGRVELVLLPPDVYGSNGVTGTKAIPAVGDAIDPSLPVAYSSADLDPTGFTAALDPSNGTSWLINFTFSPAKASAFETWSGQHVNEYLALVIDGKVQNVPYIASKITGGKGQIAGGYTEAQAVQLVTLLSSGPLPVPLQLESDSGAVPQPSSGCSTVPAAVASPGTCGEGAPSSAASTAP